jgi:hypothetical protein
VQLLTSRVSESTSAEQGQPVCQLSTFQLRRLIRILKCVVRVLNFACEQRRRVKV